MKLVNEDQATPNGIMAIWWRVAPGKRDEFSERLDSYPSGIYLLKVTRELRSDLSTQEYYLMSTVDGHSFCTSIGAHAFYRCMQAEGLKFRSDTDGD